MTSTRRRIVRGAAAGMGAIALLLGAAACTAGEEEEPSGPSTAQEETPPAEEGAASSDGSTPAPSDGGGEDGAGPFGDDELDAAAQRFVDGLQVLDDQDWEAACGYVLDPSTGTAPEAERRQECADGVEPALGAHGDLLQPGVFDAIDTSMVEASDNGDGTVALSVQGQQLDIPMVLGDDGQWYFSIPF